MRKKLEIVRRLASGETVAKIADSLGISRQYVYQIKKDQTIKEAAERLEEEYSKIDKAWKEIEEEKKWIEECEEVVSAYFCIEKFKEKRIHKVHIYELGFSKRTENALKRNGILFAHQLDCIDEKQVRLLNWIGQFGADEILNERKKRWRDKHGVENWNSGG